MSYSTRIFLLVITTGFLQYGHSFCLFNHWSMHTLQKVCMQGITANGTLITSKHIEHVISSGMSGFVGLVTYSPSFISVIIFWMWVSFWFSYSNFGSLIIFPECDCYGSWSWSTFWAIIAVGRGKFFGISYLITWGWKAGWRFNFTSSLAFLRLDSRT